MINTTTKTNSVHRAMQRLQQMMMDAIETQTLLRNNDGNCCQQAQQHQKARLLMQMGKLQRQEGNQIDAEKYLRQANGIYAQLQETSYQALSLHELSHSLREQSRYQEAETCLNKVIKNRLQESNSLPTATTTTNVDVAVAYHDLGVVLKLQGQRWSESVAAFQTAAIIFSRSLGLSHRRTMASWEEFESCREEWMKKSQTLSNLHFGDDDCQQIAAPAA